VWWSINSQVAELHDWIGEKSKIGYIKIGIPGWVLVNGEWKDLYVGDLVRVDYFVNPWDHEGVSELRWKRCDFRGRINGNGKEIGIKSIAEKNSEQLRLLWKEFQ
jgi:hypothetical protein